MNLFFARCHCTLTLLLFSLLPFSPAAAPLTLVSARDPSVPPPAGGAADSGSPILSADGRFVLFASFANNLAVGDAGTPFRPLFPPVLNVYLRDRVSDTTTLVSVNLARTGGGNADSVPAAVSADGRYVLFESTASDLVANDANNASDLFVRDLQTGTTTLVSVTAAGGTGNGASRSGVMTPNGRYVAFVSEATDLVDGDTNGIPDVFVRDLQTGATLLASLEVQSAQPSLVPLLSESPCITPDGRFVAFCTAFSSSPRAAEVFVRDLAAGVTLWASTNAVSILRSSINPSASRAFSCSPRLSDDGRFVAFEICKEPPYAPSAGVPIGVIVRHNLLTGITDVLHTNAATAVAAYAERHSLDMTPDGRFIAFCANTTATPGTNTVVWLWDAQAASNTLVSADLATGKPPLGVSDGVALDVAGRRVAFLSTAANLVTNALRGDSHLYVRDMQTGLTSLMDVDTNGVGQGVSPAILPSLSPDGRRVAFEQTGGNLVPGNHSHNSDIFVRDLAGDTTELASPHHPTLPALAPNNSCLLSRTSASTNGRYFAFASTADDLTPNDTNGCRDVFVHDLAAGTTSLVSVATNGMAGSDMSLEPSISGDGRYVAFSSYATDLVNNDTNNAQDVFLRDLLSDTTVLVSLSNDGASPGNRDSYQPQVSTDGRFVLYRSKAQNLTADYVGNVENLFLRDLQLGSNYALTASASTAVTSASMTPDGRFVAVIGDLAGTGTKLFVWDSLAARRIYTNTNSPLFGVFISPSGKRLACFGESPPVLRWVDIDADTTSLVCAGTLREKVCFSGDDRFLAYCLRTTNTQAGFNVYLYDSQTATNLLVSHAFGSPGAADGGFEPPYISPDGRFVAYSSASPAMVPNDYNGVPDLFLFDRLRNATVLVSLPQASDSTANNRSSTPVFSADGQSLFFQSHASDLVARDSSFSRKIFSFSLPASGLAGTGQTNLPPAFSLQLLPPTAPGSGPLALWPWTPDWSSRLQFKDDLSEPDWHDLPASTALIGDTTYACDPAPAPGRRFYRILLSQ